MQVQDKDKTPISFIVKAASILLRLNPGRLERKFREREIYQTIRVEPPIALRLDGVGWGRRLRGRYDWPRDPRIHRALVRASVELVRELHACCGLVISDELNIVITREPPYNGRVEKIVSISAGIASATISAALGHSLYLDSRVVKLHTVHDAIEYMLYRMRVGLNNYVSSIYHSLARGDPARTPSLEQMITELEGMDLPPLIWEPWRLLGTCTTYTKSLKQIGSIRAERRRLISIDAAPGLCIRALKKAFTAP